MASVVELLEPILGLGATPQSADDLRQHHGRDDQRRRRKYGFDLGQRDQLRGNRRLYQRNLDEWRYHLGLDGNHNGYGNKWRQFDGRRDRRR